MTPLESSAATRSVTRSAPALSMLDNIDRYTTMANTAPATASATKTTEAATNADRADMPQADVSRRGIAAPVSRTMLPVSDMRQVHEWFLHRGLPLVLTRRVRSRALIERSAPMVSGIGAIIALTMMLAELTDGDPDFGYVFRLGGLRCCSWGGAVRAIPAAP